MIMLLLCQISIWSTVGNTFFLAQLFTVSIVLHPFILDKCYFWNSIDARTRFSFFKKASNSVTWPLLCNATSRFISYALPVCIRMLLACIRVLLVCSRLLPVYYSYVFVWPVCIRVLPVCARVVF